MKIRFIYFIFFISFLSFSLLKAQNEAVYTDNLAENWFEDIWGDMDYNLQYATSPYQGNYCIEMQFPDWGSVGFDHRDAYWAERYYYYPNQYKYLNFYFKSGAPLSQIENMRVTLDLGESVIISDYLPGTISADTWYNVRIPITDLNPDNKKFFRIYFSNESSSLTPHIFIDDIILEYVDDNEPPVISNFAVSEIEQDIATISWNTDEPVIYTFSYRIQGSGEAYTVIETDEYSSNGEINISGLTPSTTYEFELICNDHQRDAGTPANESTESGTFSTSAADETNPVISGLKMINIYENRVIIGWNTNEPSDTKLNYGQGSYSTEYFDELKKCSHTVVLTHLKPSTEYQYKISSEDRFGNISEVVDTPAFTFTTSAKTESNDKWILADHPLYQWDEVGPNDVPWHQITHLNLGQLWPVASDSGYTLGIEPNSWWSDGWGGFSHWQSEAKQFIENGHKASRKVICMLGGAGSNPDGQWNDATSEENVVVFAQNIRKVLEGIGFDGTDIDWEDNIDFPSFINLAKELRAAWPNAIITIPTGLNGDDAADFAPAEPYVDAFTPMSYYPIPQWGGWLIPIPITPLYSAGDNPYSIEYTLNNWINAGVPSSKINMGIGGFGAVWGDNNEDGIAPIKPYANMDDVNGYANGERESMGADNLVTWSFVHNILEDYPKLSESWDTIGLCTYWHTNTIEEQLSILYPGRDYYMNISLIFYETARSMSHKVEYVEKKNMRGINYWTLSQLIDNGFSPVLDVASCLQLDTTSVTPVEPTNFNTSIHRNLSIYPNPVKDMIHIDNIEPTANIIITDMLGNVIINNTLKNENNTIDFTGYKGIYILILKDNSGNIVESRKIITL